MTKVLHIVVEVKPASNEGSLLAGRLPSCSRFVPLNVIPEVTFQFGEWPPLSRFITVSVPLCGNSGNVQRLHSGPCAAHRGLIRCCHQRTATLGSRPAYSALRCFLRTHQIVVLKSCANISKFSVKYVKRKFF